MTVKGNTSGSISSIPINLPCLIRSIILTNKSAAAITVNCSIVSNATGVSLSIIPKDNSIAIGGQFVSSTIIEMPAGLNLIISTSGSLDYYISLKPMD